MRKMEKTFFVLHEADDLLDHLARLGALGILLGRLKLGLEVGVDDEVAELEEGGAVGDIVDLHSSHSCARFIAL